MRSEAEVKTTEEQVQHLLACYSDTKDIRLRDKVILQYRQLVESIARRFVGSGEPLDDLVQEGYIGLLTATDRYSADKGVKFSTFATHFIIGQIKHALRDKRKIIKEPAWLQELNHRMTRVIDALYQELGRQPTCTEIGQEMHLPEETVEELLTTREVFKVSSLDCDQDDASPGSELDKVTDDKCTTFQLPVEDKIVLEMAMNKLKIVEQKVIQEFYYTGLSQTEIARKIGISCNYVSHILRNGTKKLRRILTTDEIREVQMQLQHANRRSDAFTAEVRADVLDGLTGTYSVAYLEDRLDEELNRAARNSSEAAFAIFSIDGLVDVHARFGTMRRDDMLCEVAQILKANVRKCDIVGRVGDSEFGVILLHTRQQASRVCARVQDAVHKAKFHVENSHAQFTLHVDVGYAVFPTDAAEGTDLISLAWEALEQYRPEELKKAA
jgi:RNA polymerase sigma-B factor